MVTERQTRSHPKTHSRFERNDWFRISSIALRWRESGQQGNCVIVGLVKSKRSTIRGKTNISTQLLLAALPHGSQIRENRSG